MARRADGWTLRKNDPAGNWLVRFRHAGKRYQRSTGTPDRRKAQLEAGRIYARVVSGRVRRERLSAPPLVQLASEWLASREGVVSAAQWESQLMHLRTHLIPHFGKLEAVTTKSANDYTRARLRRVKRATVLKELSTLRLFVGWCAGDGGVMESAPRIDNPPTRSTGTPHKNGKQRRVEVTPELAARILAALPETTAKGNPARAFFRLMWETGLRKATLERIEAPGDYARGGSRLRIRAEIDKARFARILPLSEAARAALDSVCPDEGPIFGAVDYRTMLRTAARDAGLPEEDARHLSHHDFRHGFGTDMARVADPVALQYLMGHRHMATTARYVHPHERSALDAIERRGIRDTGRDTARESIDEGKGA